MKSGSPAWNSGLTTCRCAQKHRQLWSGPSALERKRAKLEENALEEAGEAWSLVSKSLKQMAPTFPALINVGMYHGK
jgi:hypothetical protein